MILSRAERRVVSKRPSVTLFVENLSQNGTTVAVSSVAKENSVSGQRSIGYTSASLNSAGRPSRGGHVVVNGQ